MASITPPVGLRQRQIDQAQNHADKMQVLGDIKIQQELQKEITIKEVEQDIELYEKMKIVAGLRNEIASLNLDTTMMNNFQSLLGEMPETYCHQELQQKYLPYQKENQATQDSIDTTNQQQPSETIKAEIIQSEAIEEQTERKKRA